MLNGFSVYRALLALTGLGTCASGLFFCALGAATFVSSFRKKTTSSRSIIQLDTTLCFLARALGTIGILNIVSGGAVVYQTVYGWP